MTSVRARSHPHGRRRGAALCAVAVVLTGTSPGQAAGAPGRHIAGLRVSREDAGDGASYGSSAMSANGRYVLFTSEASNLVAGDTNGESDAFVRDLASGAPGGSH